MSSSKNPEQSLSNSTPRRFSLNASPTRSSMTDQQQQRRITSGELIDSTTSGKKVAVDGSGGGGSGKGAGARYTPCCLVYQRHAEGSESSSPAQGQQHEQQWFSDANQLRAKLRTVKSKLPPRNTDGFISDLPPPLVQQPRPMLVVRGLPEAFVPLLVEDLGIDTQFLDAHAERRVYRPLPTARHPGPNIVQFEYPEFVTGFDDAVKNGRLHAHAPVDAAVDLRTEPPVLSISDVDDLAVVFCHVSVWAGPEFDIVLLERPLWLEDSARSTPAPLKRARRKVSVVRQRQSNGAAPLGNTFTTLEEDLIGSLWAVPTNTISLTYKLSLSACDRWLELFDTMTLQQGTQVDGAPSLYWQMTRSLENNRNMANDQGYRMNESKSANLDWRTLDKRLKRRIQLAAVLSSTSLEYAKPISVQPSPPQVIPVSAEPEVVAYDNRQPAAKSGDVPYGLTSIAPLQPQTAEENQRSLDRVSFLGGILLPSSLVSGMLSMNSDFEPGGPLFWVFFAIAGPLTVFSILVIYADILRKAEVWVEASAEGVAAAVLSTQQRIGNSLDAGRRADNDDEDADDGSQKDKIGGGRQKPGGSSTQYPSQPSGTSSTTPYSYPRPVPPTSTDTTEATTYMMPESTLAPTTEAYTMTYNVGDDVVLDIEGAMNARAAHEALEQTTATQNTTDDSQPTMILERPGDGGQPRAWKKQELGWYGAGKAIFGVKKPRRAVDIPMGVPAKHWWAGHQPDKEKRG